MELLLNYPNTINIDGTMVEIPYVRLFLRLSNFRFFPDIFQIANNSIRSNCILYHFFKKLFKSQEMKDAN